MSYSRWSNDPIWYTFWSTQYSHGDSRGCIREEQRFEVMVATRDDQIPAPERPIRRYLIRYPAALADLAGEAARICESEGLPVNGPDAARLRGYMARWVEDVRSDEELR